MGNSAPFRASPALGDPAHTMPLPPSTPLSYPTVVRSYVPRCRGLGLQAPVPSPPTRPLRTPPVCVHSETSHRRQLHFAPPPASSSLLRPNSGPHRGLASGWRSRPVVPAPLLSGAICVPRHTHAVCTVPCAVCRVPCAALPRLRPKPSGRSMGRLPFGAPSSVQNGRPARSRAGRGRSFRPSRAAPFNGLDLAALRALY